MNYDQLILHTQRKNSKNNETKLKIHKEKNHSYTESLNIPNNESDFFRSI